MEGPQAQGPGDEYEAPVGSPGPGTGWHSDCPGVLTGWMNEEETRELGGLRGGWGLEPSAGTFKCIHVRGSVLCVWGGGCSLATQRHAGEGSQVGAEGGAGSGLGWRGRGRGERRGTGGGWGSLFWKVLEEWLVPEETRAQAQVVEAPDPLLSEGPASRTPFPRSSGCSLEPGPGHCLHS